MVKGIAPHSAIGGRRHQTASGEAQLRGARRVKSEISIAEHGDLLERENAEHVRERFPAYERIWSIYVGNNGRAEPLNLMGASENHLKQREKCSQSLYTILQSMVLMKGLSDRVSKRLFPEFLSITNDDSRILEYHLVTVNDFLAFHAHAGRVRDQVERVGELWKQYDLANGLQDVYERRHTVLHGSAIPMGMVEGAATILVPAGRAPKEHEWSTEKSWREGSDHQELVSEYMQGTLREVESAVQNALARLESLIHDFLKEKGLELESHVTARERISRDAISVVSQPDVRRL